MTKRERAVTLRQIRKAARKISTDPAPRIWSSAECTEVLMWEHGVRVTTNGKQRCRRAALAALRELAKESPK